jgi:hypothetical protein
MIGAEVGDNVVSQAGNRAVILAAHFDSSDLGAAMDGGLNIFASRLNPFDRLTELDRNPAEQSFFGIDI